MNNKAYVVRGTLALVLRCCRVFGMAPLLFEKLQSGYKITVSYKYAVYSYILTTFLSKLITSFYEISSKCCFRVTILWK